MGFFSSLFGIEDHKLTIRVGNRQKDTDSDIYFRRISVKGQFLLQEYGGSSAKVIIRLTDLETDDPIITHFPSFQASSDNPVFHIEQDLGYIEAGQYLPKFTPMGMIPDEQFLIGPYKGNRDVKVVFVVSDYSGNVINVATEEIKINFTESGYSELDKDRLNTQKAAIKLACIIAGSDGNLQKSELKIIKDFAKEMIEFALDKHKNKIKKELNNAIESGIKQGKKIAASKTKRVNTTAITKKVKEIASDRDKRDLLDLCLKVMAGDGTADTNELKILGRIATEIDIDYDDYQNEKDKFMIGLNILSDNQDHSDITSMEKMMGIKSNWSVKRKITHLKKEFRKWNARTATLGDSKKEQNAQKMLDVIARLRRYYEEKN